MINKYFLAKMNIPAYLKKFLYERYGYTEIEEIPPIIFKGNGENLLDYRIDGASGGVGERTKNLFNFNKWSENLTTNANNELIISNNSITITAVENDAFTTPYYANHPNIYKIDVLPNSQYVLSWDSNNTLSGKIFAFKNGLTGSGNQISVNNATQKYITFSTDGDTTFITIRFGVMKVGDSITYSNIQLEEGSTATNYEPYGYKVPVVISGKNLLPPINEWESGYINTSGTVSSANVDRKEMASPFIKVNPNETYAFSFYPNEGDAWRCAGYYTANKEFVSRKFASATSDPIIFTIPANVEFIRLCYRTYGDGTYAQLEQNSEVTTYEPYHEPTTTNIYIDEPIEENESVSLSDTNTNIPTIKGTNILTVDTTVQPSNVYIKVGGE